VLGKTLGVPLFQEQAMQVAIVAAGFTPSEADQLRRAMGAFKFTAGVTRFRDKLVQGMIDNGYDPAFAERTFKQLEGFGSYGFPESHAASFALIAYASSWMKCHHPEVFCCAILNSQPMGFYAPAQVVRDAREHGVEVRPWTSTARVGLHAGADRNGQYAVRLGMRMVRGLQTCMGPDRAREGRGPYAPSRTLAPGRCRAALRGARARTPPGFLGPRRRERSGHPGLRDEPLPLFAAATPEASSAPSSTSRPSRYAMTAGAEVAEDYAARAVPAPHPLAFLRPDLAGDGYITCAELARVPDRRRIEVAGLVLVRQKPGSAKGVMFITLEDETGVANLIVWPKLFEKQRRLVLSAGMMGCRGQVQRQGEVTHVIVDCFTDLTGMLRRVGEMDEAFPLTTGRGDEARHGGSPDQRGRGDRRNAEGGGLGRRSRDIYVPDLSMEALRAGQEESAAPPIRVKARDFR
jgi:error-prone DNA polymerase